MAVFSRRNGYNLETIQVEQASNQLKKRIYSIFYKREFDYYDTLDWRCYTTGIEDMMIEMGLSYEFPENNIVKQKNAKNLEEYLLKSNEWYIIYDFIEKYLRISDVKTKEKMALEFNKILEDEMSAYRILDFEVVPIVNKLELEAVKEAKNTAFDTVNTHISKALSLYSDRKKPDYENSIKESISAVEAMCSIITGIRGANATLGKTIKKLKDNGLHIHQGMEKAFSSLYGYTSDESGIRHGCMNFLNAPSEDAKYMLISCSAFINYLIEKWTKIKK